MAKLPAFQLYTGDWKKDPQLSLCSPATRGIWIDLICAMHDADRSGQLCSTTEKLARIVRCSTAEIDQALTELSDTGTADVTFRNEKIQICNRRMFKEWKDRKDAAFRVKKHRDKKVCNNNVTPYSSSSVSSSLQREEKANAPPSVFPEGQCWDVEDDLLKNPIQLEQICIAARKDVALAKKALTKFHLWLQENERYPKPRKALYAGFTRWLLNEKETKGANEDESVKKMMKKYGL